MTTLTWLCPNCALESRENFCSACGRRLTANDLTPASNQTAASGAKPGEGKPLTAERSLEDVRS